MSPKKRSLSSAPGSDNTCSYSVTRLIFSHCPLPVLVRTVNNHRNNARGNENTVSIFRFRARQSSRAYPWREGDEGARSGTGKQL